MRRSVSGGTVVALGLAMWGCGGYATGSGGSPSDPLPPTASGVVTVNVVGVNGAQSFSPDPARLPSGQRIVWRNVDTITHRVVFDDGTMDTGNLVPGAASAPMLLQGRGGRYHCSIHPGMVGRVNDAAAVPATCQGPSCD